MFISYQTLKTSKTSAFMLGFGNVVAKLQASLIILATHANWLAFFLHFFSLTHLNEPVTVNLIPRYLLTTSSLAP